MGREKYAREPLLYIDQRNIQTPIAPMQEEYYTPKQVIEISAPTEVQPIRKQRTRPLKRTYTEEEDQIKREELEVMKDEEVLLERHEDDKQVEKQEKSFKEMNLEQRIEYFINRPSHAPKLKCEIQTTTRKYRGVITGAKEGLVFITVGRRTTVEEVEVSEIQSIHFAWILKENRPRSKCTSIVVCFLKLFS